MSQTQTQRFTDLLANFKSGDSPLTIACFGDSVTMGYTGSGVVEQDNVYHARLKRMLNNAYPRTVVNVINAGAAGGSAASSFSRFVRDVTHHKPDVLFIGFGLNDSGEGEAGLADFSQALTALVNTARESGITRIALITSNFMSTKDNPRVATADRRHVTSMNDRQNSGLIAKYAQTVRETAAKLNIPVADVYARWEALAKQGVDTDTLLANGLNHPSGQAHQIHADAAFEVIMGM